MYARFDWFPLNDVAILLNKLTKIAEQKWKLTRESGIFARLFGPQSIATEFCRAILR
jgi:hypothetical protein